MLVTVEVMPDLLRERHRKAGDWGFWPHNGAVRVDVEDSEAIDLVMEDKDGYNFVVDND